MSSIKAFGGCGQDANGFEALYLAMNSDFVTGPKDRQIIVMLADTSAIPCLKRKDFPGYPTGMVDYNSLCELWTCVSQSSLKLKEKLKRLLIFAPKDSNYYDLALKLNRSIFIPVEVNNGLEEVESDAIFKQIAGSASGA